MDWVSLLLLIVVVGATSFLYFLFHQRRKRKQMNGLQRWKEWQRRTIHREQGQEAHKPVHELSIADTANRRRRPSPTLGSSVDQLDPSQEEPLT